MDIKEGDIVRLKANKRVRAAVRAVLSDPAPTRLVLGVLTSVNVEDSRRRIRGRSYRKHERLNLPACCVERV